MVLRRLLLAAVAAATLVPAMGAAQGVPPYEPPTPVGPPQRDGTVMAKPSRGDTAVGAADSFGSRAATVGSFADSYRRNGKPRLALYWNRQLSEALSDWYSDVRVLNSNQSNSTLSGDLTLKQSGQDQNTLEIQRRVQDSRRPTVSESFEWEFQEAFLGPFLEAGATVVDRGAMMRFTAADDPAAGEKTVEVRGLQGKADYLLEVLVAPNWKSSTGYELRTRILDVKSGAIVAMVNSKNLHEWNPDKETTVGPNGFSLPDEDDEESFGPQGDDKYRATATGFERKRKPPKLAKIARNLAYNTMDGLMRQWK